VIAGRTDIVWPISKAESRLSGNEHLASFALDGLAKDFLRQAVRINIRRIEEIYACFETDRDQAFGFFNIGLTPGPEEFVSATERAGAKTQRRHFQSGMPQLPVIHVCHLSFTGVSQLDQHKTKGHFCQPSIEPVPAGENG